MSVMTPKREVADTWLTKWGRHNAEDCPVGKDYLLVINTVLLSELYTEFKAEWPNLNLGRLPCLSISLFRDRFFHWMDTNKVRMREKKNVSGKCDGGSHRVAV